MALRVPHENLPQVQTLPAIQRDEFEAELKAEIEQAKTLLVAHPEEDSDEGSYSAETLDRAIAVLKAHLERAWNSRGVKAPLPTIGPGPHGSVDLYWRQPGWKLLVNIPANAEDSATFYGDDYGRQKTKGSFDPNEVSIAIVAWLMS